MNRKGHPVRMAGLLAATLGAILVAMIAFPVLAMPDRHTNPNPTPTLPPMQNVAYDLQTVGGEDTPQTFAVADQEGFRIGATSVNSQYPRGMVFTVAPESAAGSISDVTLFYQFVRGSGSRHSAEYNPGTGQWIAHIWSTGDGYPAFGDLRFHWRIRDETGAVIDTEEFEINYWDPHREWFRVESDDIIIYWFGFAESEPDAFAQSLVQWMAVISERLIAGFGRRLSYKPLVIIYPNLATAGEIFETGTADSQIGGFASIDTGMSVQWIYDPLQEVDETDCKWTWSPDDWTIQDQIQTTLETMAHEVTHLYQYDVMGYAPGYVWISEGQADFFANWFSMDWVTLPYLATLQDIPPLTTNISSRTIQADGCFGLAYLVGASFWNHLNIHYGGMDTIAEIIQLQRQQKLIYEAVESVTGKPFLEVENEWRVNYGFAPLTLADIDPASALEPYEDNMIAAGDVITLPAVPPLAPMKDKPGPKGLPGAQCFANTPVTVQTIGALDGVPYYQIDCMGMVGWVTRDQLISE